MSTDELRYDLLGQGPLFGSYGVSTVARHASRSLLWKLVFDRSIALLLLIPALPLIGLLILAVRLTSRGPGLYRQVRVGKCSVQGDGSFQQGLHCLKVDAGLFEAFSLP